MFGFATFVKFKFAMSGVYLGGFILCYLWPWTEKTHSNKFMVYLTTLSACHTIRRWMVQLLMTKLYNVTTYNTVIFGRKSLVPSSGSKNVTSVIFNCTNDWDGSIGKDLRVIQWEFLTPGIYSFFSAWKETLIPTAVCQKRVYENKKIKSYR